MSDLIFLSYSKPKSEILAHHLKGLIGTIFEKTKFEYFMSSDPYDGANVGDDFREEILKNISRTKIGISIFTPENRERSPYLMWESGGLLIKTKENKGAYIPFAFDVPANAMDHPVSNRNILHYVSDMNNEDNLKTIKKFIFAIHKGMSDKEKYNLYEIESRLKELWENGYSEKLDQLEREMKDLSASGYGNKRSSAGGNEFISFETFDQIDFSLTNSFAPKKICDLEVMFEQFINTQQILPKYILQKKFANGEISHKIVIGSTRLSNFAAFTDGRRMVIYDRTKDKFNTDVTNERYDVFGSVYFENRTIKTKIKSRAFLDAKILKIQEICGLAIEDNHHKTDPEIKDTAVMLGICVYVSEKDLDFACLNAKNEEILIADIKTLQRFDKSKLTSKAQLALRHLTSRT